MQNPEILEEIFDKKTIRLIQLFLNNKEKQFYLREISKEANIPLASTSRLVNKLLKLNILKLIKISKFKLYQLANNDNTKFLEKFLKKEVQMLNKFIDSIKDFPGLQYIILHGEEEKDRANVLLIGENIDTGAIKEVVANIKEGDKFTVSALVLAPEQYE